MRYVGSFVSGFLWFMAGIIVLGWIFAGLNAFIGAH